VATWSSTDSPTANMNTKRCESISRLLKPLNSRRSTASSIHPRILPRQPQSCRANEEPSNRRAIAARWLCEFLRVRLRRQDYGLTGTAMALVHAERLLIGEMQDGLRSYTIARARLGSSRSFVHRPGQPHRASLFLSIPQVRATCAARRHRS
jgi:hypothetical protein